MRVLLLFPLAILSLCGGCGDEQPEVTLAGIAGSNYVHGHPIKVAECPASSLQSPSGDDLFFRVFTFDSARLCPRAAACEDVSSVEFIAVEYAAAWIEDLAARYSLVGVSTHPQVPPYRSDGELEEWATPLVEQCEHTPASDALAPLSATLEAVVADKGSACLLSFDPTTRTEATTRCWPRSEYDRDILGQQPQIPLGLSN
jgi:hypothetical protein